MLPDFAHRPFSSISLCVALGLTVLQPIAAFADLKAAETCAVTLSPDQRLIYEAVKPDVKLDADLFKLVRTKVIALVTAGRVPRSSAPDDAQIAAKCLKLLQS
jgi:hypothetical protein